MWELMIKAITKATVGRAEYEHNQKQLALNYCGPAGGAKTVGVAAPVGYPDL